MRPRDPKKIMIPQDPIQIRKIASNVYGFSVHGKKASLSFCDLWIVYRRPMNEHLSNGILKVKVGVTRLIGILDFWFCEQSIRALPSKFKC